MSLDGWRQGWIEVRDERGLAFEAQIVRVAPTSDADAWGIWIDGLRLCGGFMLRDKPVGAYRFASARAACSFARVALRRWPAFDESKKSC